MEGQKLKLQEESIRQHSETVAWTKIAFHMSLKAQATMKK